MSPHSSVVYCEHLVWSPTAAAIDMICHGTALPALSYSFVGRISLLLEALYVIPLLQRPNRTARSQPWTGCSMTARLSDFPRSSWLTVQHGIWQAISQLFTQCNLHETQCLSQRLSVFAGYVWCWCFTFEMVHIYRLSIGPLLSAVKQLCLSTDCKYTKNVRANLPAVTQRLNCYFVLSNCAFVWHRIFEEIRVYFRQKWLQLWIYQRFLVNSALI